MNAIADGISTQQWMMIAAIILAIVVVMRMGYRRRPLDGSPRQYRREIDSATTQSSAIKRDMEHLLVELEELSRNINAQIDTKFAKLEQSIADADRRISALRILIEESKRIAADASGSAASHGTETPTGAAAGSPEEIESPAGIPAQGTGQPTQDAPASPAPDERHQRIYDLADKGRTAVQIAQELQEQPGEVELILNLRKAES